MKSRLLDQLFSFASFGAISSPTIECSNSKLDHVAVLVDSTDEVVASLRSVFSASQFAEIMHMSNDSFGKLKLTYVNLGGFWLEFVEPLGQGPMRDHLNEIGSGTIIELDFETDNLLQCSRWLAARKVAMTNVNGTIYNSGTPGTLLEPYGIRFAYVDKAKTNGLSIEYYQRGPVQPDILTRRDSWQDTILTSSDFELSSVDIQVVSLEKSRDAFEKLGFATSNHFSFDVEDASRSALVKTNGINIRLYEARSCEQSKCDDSKIASDVIRSITVCAPKSVYDNFIRSSDSKQPGLVIIPNEGPFDNIDKDVFSLPGLKVRIEPK